MNYKQVWAMKKANEKRILRICPNMKNESGIYCWHRVDENGYGRFYAGQSVSLIDRSVSHLMAYDHLGLSIKKWGLKDDKHPYGWELEYYYCNREELDEKEQEEIKKWLSKGMVAYNITGGSQGKGKTDINERKPARGYYDGKKQGYKDAQKFVAHLFKLYLKAEINGKKTARSESAMEKFSEFIKGGENDVERTAENESEGR